MDITSTDYDYGDVVHPTLRPLDIPSGVNAYKWVAIFLYALVIILGVPGNGLVVWITAFEMKRSVNTIWFFNLAVADLLCCLSVPFSIMNITVGWPLGLFACKFIPSILLINMFASVLLLTMISIDRCALVMRPVWCQNHRTLRKAYIACAVMWILAIILSSPSFIFRNVNNSHGKVCEQDYSLTGHDSQQRVENFIAISRLLLGFIIPFLVIVTCYSILIKRVKDRFTKNTKTMKVILVVIIGFFICWLPYHVAGLILALHPSHSELYQFTFTVDTIFVAIAFMNSCINPIIYVLMGQDIKSKFKRSIRLILKNVLAEEVSESVFDSKKSKSISETKNTEASV
ncbi:C3a anaphylatoxin chemotactic receptor-like [Bufo gargarizans]|uniref:C3a anaphylatoxin chemotactic receptor-like n=1 Tax=Bufo gargarizans TaxID=30331 RepID=UPI001CF2EC4F|nr:C3a anaphylatoxin chemotactic receptor-like [Bufo gargarizans]XP_044161594.1 C3a anaphylatoxin chemotactic receptor-like [Bufo gargarizans]